MRKFLVVAAAAMIAALPLTVSAQTKQGGEMIVTYKDDVSTLDPAIGYDWQNWSIIKSIFSGLMDYEPGSTVLVPDLAENYEISEDGLTYTFTLREGVKFHNGRELTSADIKYSIERTVNPATQSPGAGFFASIVGFDEVVAGETTDLLGISTPDDRTVVFQLSAPNATFLHVMAINFSFAVPREVVEEYGAGFRHASGRHRRLQARRMDARPAPRARAQRGLFRGRPALSRSHRLRGRPGADGRTAAAPERRGRHSRRRHPAGAVRGGDERSGQ